MSKEKVIIIGAGPAGISCAIQLKRQGFNPVIIEKKEPGGLIRNAHRIDNYPGFPKGISGEKFCKLMLKQFEQYRIGTISDEVLNIDFKKNQFGIHCIKDNYQSDILVIATGTLAKKPELPEIPEIAKTKIYTEIYPLLKSRDKNFVIIGGGDAAFDYALSLSKNNSIVIINRNSSHKCLKYLFFDVNFNPNILYLMSTIINNINYENNLFTLNCTSYAGDIELICNYLIYAIGREAKLDILSPNLKSREGDLMKQKKLYIIGDVKNGEFRQLSISIGDGVRAAMEISSKF